MYKNKIIVITDEAFLQNEVEAIIEIIKAKAFRVHIRKPNASEEELRALLQRIPVEYHSSISIHDHFALVKEFTEIGIHLNTRSKSVPLNFTQCISASCHDEEQLKFNKPYCFYMFLSPVFDSISKKGYNGGFTHDELLRMSHAAIIDSKVFALGGITPETLKHANEIGFGGAVVLGYLWEKFKEDASIEALVNRLKTLQDV